MTNHRDNSGRQAGPVTLAIAAMRADPEPPRRGILKGLAALPLIGTVFGMTAVRAASPDLSFAAEEYLRDAYALGLWFNVGRDGDLWIGQPVQGAEADFDARDRLRDRLIGHPRLRQAVVRVLRERGMVCTLRSAV